MISIKENKSPYYHCLSCGVQTTTYNLKIKKCVGENEGMSIVNLDLCAECLQNMAEDLQFKCKSKLFK